MRGYDWTGTGEYVRSCKADPSVRVTFPEPVTAVAEGQVVGLWDGDMCLGSGIIEGTRTKAETASE